MFAKKFLSIVGLLFLGNQITSVLAACNPSYSGGLKINSDCEIGYYLVNAGGNGAETDPGTNCTDGNCSLKYCSKNDDNTLCENVSIQGFAKFSYDNSILKCTASGCKSHSKTSEDGCNANSLNDFDTNGKFCTANTGTGIDYTVSGVYHYITVKSGTTSVFTGPSELGADTKVVVKIGDGIIKVVSDLGSDNYLGYDGNDIIALTGNPIAKSGLTTTSINCIDGATAKIEDRRTNYCGSDVPCYGYCTCSSGDCTILGDGDFTIETRSTCNPKGTQDEKDLCVDGYYIYYDSALITASTTTASMDTPANIKLAKCENHVCTAIDDNFPVGFIANVDTRSKTNVPFVKCTSAQCSVLANGDSVADLESATTAGLLIGETEICLVATKKSVNLSSSGMYLLDAKAVNAFTTHAVADHFVIVKVEYGSVTLYSKVEGDEYRYKYSDSTLKIFGRKATDICDSSKTMDEYMFDDIDDTINGYDEEYYVANGQSVTWP